MRFWSYASGQTDKQIYTHHNTSQLRGQSNSASKALIDRAPRTIGERLHGTTRTVTDVLTSLVLGRCQRQLSWTILWLCRESVGDKLLAIPSASWMLLHAELEWSIVRTTSDWYWPGSPRASQWEIGDRPAMSAPAVVRYLRDCVFSLSCQLLSFQSATRHRLLFVRYPFPPKCQIAKLTTDECNRIETKLRDGIFWIIPNVNGL